MELLAIGNRYLDYAEDMIELAMGEPDPWRREGRLLNAASWLCCADRVFEGIDLPGWTYKQRREATDGGRTTNALRKLRDEAMHGVGLLYSEGAVSYPITYPVNYKSGWIDAADVSARLESRGRRGLSKGEAATYDRLVAGMAPFEPFRVALGWLRSIADDADLRAD